MKKGMPFIGGIFLLVNIGLSGCDFENTGFLEEQTPKCDDEWKMVDFGSSEGFTYGNYSKTAATPFDYKERPNAIAIPPEKRSELRNVFVEGFLERQINWNKSYKEDEAYYIWAKSVDKPCAYILKITSLGGNTYFLKPLRYHWKTRQLRIWEGKTWQS